MESSTDKTIVSIVLVFGFVFWCVCVGGGVVEGLGGRVMMINCHGMSGYFLSAGCSGKTLNKWTQSMN